jgi:hypothetical protein
MRCCEFQKFTSPLKIVNEKNTEIKGINVCQKENFYQRPLNGYSKSATPKLKKSKKNKELIQ